MSYSDEQIAAAVEVAEAGRAYYDLIVDSEAARMALAAAESPEAFRAARAELARLSDYKTMLGPICDRQAKAREQWAKVRPA